MSWFELVEPVEVDMEKIQKLSEYGILKGVELHEDGTITIKRGTAFCGRPIHEWYVTYKGEKKNGKVVFTHFAFDEWHTSSPNTLGFGLFFPEIVEPFETSEDEIHEIAQDFIEELKDYENIKLFEVEILGEKLLLWEFEVEMLEQELKQYKVLYKYKCKDCHHEAIIIYKPNKCRQCFSKNLEVKEMRKEDIKIVREVEWW
ncbi:hypothetical protein J7L81_02300 [Candidatus Aerophobetes bacterium]|nr:hypothetical protein [Candidatus Aerophobetes bacterium]